MRAKGAGALQQVVGGAVGMLEFLLEELLDESFAASNAFERAARVEAVKKLLVDENDPLVRSMLKTYADRLAGRLDFLEADSFRALERSVAQALAEAGPPPPAGPTQRDARVAAKRAGSMERAGDRGGAHRVSEPAGRAGRPGGARLAGGGLGHDGGHAFSLRGGRSAGKESKRRASS